jgi:hypothetical protein
MERAIKDLCQLGIPALIYQAATGIRHILEVVDRLDGAAQELVAASRHHAGRILSHLAAEEAAKVLILVWGFGSQALIFTAHPTFFPWVISLVRPRRRLSLAPTAGC